MINKNVQDKRIVHISDLHCKSSREWESSFDMLMDDVARNNPDLILITGDIVNNPFKKSFVLFKNKLEAFCSDNDIDMDLDVVIVPGNHDFKFIGNLRLFKSSKLKDIIKFSEDKALGIFEKHGVAIFPYNSIPSTEPFLATGKINKKEISKNRKIIDALEKKYGDLYSECLKIALLHHHPIPIASSDSGKLTSHDSLMLLANAGTFMREITALKVDIIMHGHKHHNHVSRIKYNVGGGDETEVTVISAGSGCIAKPKKQYNLIQISPSRVTLVSKIAEHEGGFMPGDPIDILPYDKIREIEYRSSLNCTKDDLSLGSVCKNIIISKYGDADISIFYRRAKIAKEGVVLDGINFAAKTGLGIIKEVQPNSTKLHMEYVEDKENTESNREVGFLSFGAKINSDYVFFNYDVSYFLLNGFATNRIQFYNMYGHVSATEYSGFEVDRKYDEFVLVLHLPDNLKPNSVTLEVRNVETNDLHHPEICYQRQNLIFSKPLGVITLKIEKPLVGYIYKVIWDIPNSKKHLERNSDFLSANHNIALIVKKLLSGDARVNEILTKRLEAVKELLDRNESIEDDEDVDISFMVFRESSETQTGGGRLEVINKIGHDSKDFSLSYGLGVAGRAYKLKTAEFHQRGASAPRYDYYSSDGGAGQGADIHEVLISIPILYSDFDIIAGVLNVGSYKHNTDLKNYKYKDVMDPFLDIVDMEFKRFLDDVRRIC